MMTEISFNDNDDIPLHDGDDVRDARGHAALLLTESLLHGMIARRVLSVAEAMDIIKTAVDVQRDTLAELDSGDPTMEKALALLVTMQCSLEADLPRD